MDAGRASTITLKARVKHHGEAPANAGLSPGHLLMAVAPGKVAKNGTASVIAQKMLAVEDSMLGKTINDAYATGEMVQYRIYSSGDEVQVRLPAAAVAVAEGVNLAADATGCFVVAAANPPLLVSLEAIDNHLGATEVFINARWL